MRLLVLGLVLLAGLKVWTQDRTYRTVMSEALIEAYRDRAIEVCRRQSPRRATLVSTAAAAGPWGSGSEAQIVIGNPDLEVAIWDTENPLWAQRYRHPHLLLTGTGEARAHCAYDLSDGVATLSMHQ
jgi:hypothetical protein